MSRIRDPYVRFCERDETEFIIQSHPTRLFVQLGFKPIDF
jgi:hypothetical protein